MDVNVVYKPTYNWGAHPVCSVSYSYCFWRQNLNPFFPTSEYLPDRMPERMSEKMPDRVPE